SCRPLEELYQTYKDRVTFLLVYIAEAHPGAILSVPTEAGGRELRIIPQIATETELLGNLRRLVQLGKLTLPAAIDNPENSPVNDFAAYPNRLYVIGEDGRVTFKGAPGPTGFRVPELDDWLHEHLN